MSTPVTEWSKVLNLPSVSLYVGALICFLALVTTRQAYKLSSCFRNKLKATAFLGTPTSSPDETKAAVMLAVFRDAWPATVSEMLQDTEAAHGMLFRSLVVTGGLVAMTTDFALLTPPVSSSPLPEYMKFGMTLVHLSRRLVIAGAVGFVFAPATGADHSVAGLRTVGQDHHHTAIPSSSALLKDTFLAAVPLQSLPSARRAEIGRTAIIGAVHCILASCMLSTLPSLDLVAVAWDGYHLFMTDSVMFARLILGDYCAIAYTALLLLRLLHVLTIQICMGVFVFHFLVGFFLPGDHSHKGFWAEYAACRLFTQLMLLASVNSWFSWPELFDNLPDYLQYAALAIAAVHFFFCFKFCCRNFFLVMRNVDYSERELAVAFDQWRFKEDLFHTALDLQLAFVEGVQEQLKEARRQGDSFAYVKNLCEQLWLLLRFHRGVGRGAKEEVATSRRKVAAKNGTPASLKGLTVKQLREMCDEKGIEHRGLKVKSDVVRALSEN